MTSVRLFFIISIFFCWTSHLAFADNPYQLFDVYMFENSNRRDMTFEEIRALVYTSSGCTGFFLKNSQNKNFIMSSRHCYDLDFVSKCKKGEITVNGISLDRKLVSAKCKTVIASSKEDDAVIFEVEFAEPFTAPTNQYSLASVEPPVCTMLQLKGFPADPSRNRQPTVSEQCWTQPSLSLHADTSFDTKENEAEMASRTEFWEANKEMLKRFYELKITPGYHNCSVYGGNSGGPVQVANKQVVLGLPFQYTRRHEVSIPKNLHAVYESIPAFVKRHKSTLEQHGISTTDSYETEMSSDCIEL